MASKDPSMISDPEEHTWVAEIDEIIDHQLDIDVEIPSVSVYQVAETITSKKPEAYEPQQIGLGPIHHFRPRLYRKMEQKKLVMMRKILKDYEIKDYKLQVLNKVRKLVPVVRSCYDMFIQHNDDSLARIFTIDGLYLLTLFHTYNGPINRHLAYLADLSVMYEDHEIVVTAHNHIEWEKKFEISIPQPELPKIGLRDRSLAQDIMMVENQIPFMVLKQIDEALQAQPGNFSHPVISSSTFRIFCEIHSPLKLCSKSQAPSCVDHLLHYMYYSIVNNIPEQKPVDTHPHNIEKPVGKVKQPKVPAELVKPLHDLATKIPVKEIVQVYEQTVSVLETFSNTKIIIIPSASTLRDESGFQFHRLEDDEGIRNIRIRGKDIYLPSITLNNDSEVILRNLVAYETLTSDNSDDSFPLNEYMGFMCALITSKDDVNYLKSNNVITGDMGVDEVAKLFTGMSSSIQTVKTKGKSNLKEVIYEINKVYESGLKMKTNLFFKKIARWLLVALKSTGSFVESSWKIVAFIVSLVTVFLLTKQAYCDAYGCDKKIVTLLPYASS